MAEGYAPASYTSQASPRYEAPGAAADYYNSPHHHGDQYLQQPHYQDPRHTADTATTNAGKSSVQNGAAGAAGSRGINLRTRIKPRRTLGSGLIPSFSSGLFLAVVIVEALAVLGLVISVFAIVQLRTEVLTQDAKTVPVFLALFVFGMVFLVLVALDAFRLHNTIQIIGAVVFQLALLITAALQVSQVRAAFENQDRYGRGVPCQDRPRRRCGAVDTLYPAVKPQLVATPIIIAVAQVITIYLTFKLWQDFGFQIYRKIGADLVKRKMMLIYQVFVVFLKFDFFFGTAFCLAYLILVSDHADAEFGLTIAALPAAIVVLILSAVAVRKEVYTLMIFCIVCMFAGIVYFVFKITRIFDVATEDEYRTVRLSMTFFSVFSIVSLVATIVLAIWCTFNFGRGLKDAHETLGSLFSSRFVFGSKKAHDGYDDGEANDPHAMGRIALTDSIPDGNQQQAYAHNLDTTITPSEDYSHGHSMASDAKHHQQRQPLGTGATPSHQPYESYPSSQPQRAPGRLQPNASIYSSNSSARQQQPPMSPTSPTSRTNNNGLSRRISLD